MNEESTRKTIAFSPVLWNRIESMLNKEGIDNFSGYVTELIRRDVQAWELGRSAAAPAPDYGEALSNLEAVRNAVKKKGGELAEESLKKNK